MHYDTGPFWTVARIAKQEGVDKHRVEYVARARGIKPLGRAGIARIFSEADAQRIGEELRAIDARREAVAS